LHPKDKLAGNIRSRIQSITIRHLIRKGINATPSPRSCDGHRTSQSQEITLPRNDEALFIQDAKFAWYKKKASSLPKNKAKHKREKR
jgi:hypothetical protein